MLLRVAVRPLPGKYSKLSTETEGRSLPTLWSTTALRKAEEWVLQKQASDIELIEWNIQVCQQINFGDWWQKYK